MPAPLATIDIGTNTVLLLIVKNPPSPPLKKGGQGGFQILRDEARITRLGEGLHASPLFHPAAQDRTLAVLREFKALCDEAGVQKIQAVGTAAFRKAKNAGEFVERVEHETGIKIEIISGDREACLSFLSAAHDFPEHKNLVVLDIGGGSTEIISEPLESGGARETFGVRLPATKVFRSDRTRLLGQSLDLGGVVLTESLVKHDPITEKEFRALQAEIDRTVESAFFRPPLSILSQSEPTLVGLAGSVTTLSAIKQGLVTWDGARVQGSILNQDDLEKMIEGFRRMTVEEKKKIPGMVAGREDTILAGTLILQKVMDVLGCEDVIVSDRGLRFGLFYETSRE